MQASCIDLGSPGYDTTYGWGFVNAYGAVQLAAACSLTVASSNPNSGVAIVVSPSDLAGRGGGTTPFNLNYTTNSAVQLTAPASLGGSYFVKWQRNATDYSTDLVTTVTMDKNYTMMAVYFTPPPLASFTATPTNGIEPVMVTFSDTSSGPITTRFWNFGDGGTTNVTTNVLVHTYSAGSYDVTLVVTGPGGVSTNIWPNYINVLSAFQNWQIQYFGSTNNPAAAPDADPLGKGMSNTNQFLAGLNPTNPASVFRIVSIQVQGTNAVIAWSTVGGKTNIVQGGIGDTDNNDPSYTNLYWDMSDPIIVSGSGDAVTNFVDDGTWWGDYSNYPVHYYRVRLAP
jgi:PKD repeat protein